MTVSAVQKNEYQPQHASVLKSVALGGLSGYALKYILPIMPHEKDERYSAFLDELKNQVRETKLKEIDAIRSSQTKTLAADTFLSLVDKNEVKVARIKALKRPLSSQVMGIITQLNDKGREVKACGIETFTALTKHIRPSSAFVLAGAGVAFLTAFVYNAFGKLSEK